MQVSIIIPVLNEEVVIAALLQQLQTCRSQGNEVIVVDGGSSDNTVLIAAPLADKIIHSAAGRASQMNAAATHASGDILWFVHADTKVPNNAVSLIRQALKNNIWGRFNVKLSGPHILFRVIETMMNVRSCVSGIATGDQGIFVRKQSFQQVNGYPSIALMEDIELSKKLKKLSRPVCIKAALITSSRRWEKRGILSTVLLMWRLRFLYWLGVRAEKLVGQYK